MSKLILFIFLSLISSAAMSVGTTGVVPSVATTPYCLSGNKNAGSFTPTGISTITYDAVVTTRVLTITETDGVNTYVTTMSYDGGGNLSGVTCAIKQ